MARASRSVHARKKRRKVLEQAKGYRGTKKSSYKRAKEQVWKSGVYAYEGRKQRKRDFRSLWIQRINAGAREHDLSYSQFIYGLRLAEIDLDRKILADLAATEPAAFAAIVAQVKNALEGRPVETNITVEIPASQPEPDTEEASVGSEQASTGQKAGGVEATEAAKREAEEHGVDLGEVEGSGVEGRVLVEDVEEAADESEAGATGAADDQEEEKA